MKHFFYTVIVLGSLCFGQRLLAQDPVKISPDEYRVILAHKQVRVLDVRLKPGAKSPLHSHPDSVVYVLSGGKLRFTTKGHSTDIAFKPGECLWREDEKHEVENIGKTTVHVIQVELD